MFVYLRFISFNNYCIPPVTAKCINRNIFKTVFSVTLSRVYLFLSLYAAGRTCSENVNDCWSLPCLNGGSCMDLINDYICHCPLGKYRLLVYYWACLQKYHAIICLYAIPWEYMKSLLLIHSLFKFICHFLYTSKDSKSLLVLKGSRRSK